MREVILPGDVLVHRPLSAAEVDRTAGCAGQGIWPAIWMLPQDQAYSPRPASGKIEILETKGRLPRQIAGTLH